VSADQAQINRAELWARHGRFPDWFKLFGAWMLALISVAAMWLASTDGCFTERCELKPGVERPWWDVAYVAGLVLMAAAGCVSVIGKLRGGLSDRARRVVVVLLASTWTPWLATASAVALGLVDRI